MFCLGPPSQKNQALRCWTVACDYNDVSRGGRKADQGSAQRQDNSREGLVMVWEPKTVGKEEIIRRQRMRLRCSFSFSSIHRQPGPKPRLADTLARSQLCPALVQHSRARGLPEEPPWGAAVGHKGTSFPGHPGRGGRSCPSRCPRPCSPSRDDERTSGAERARTAPAWLRTAAAPAGSPAYPSSAAPCSSESSSESLSEESSSSSELSSSSSSPSSLRAAGGAERAAASS